MFMQKFLIRFVLIFVATGVMTAGMRFVPMPFGAVFPILFVALVLYIVRDFLKLAAGGQLFQSKPIPNGVRANARIVALRQTGTSASILNVKMIELHVDVQIIGADGNEWPASLTQMVDLINLATLRPGEVINVIYDPANPSHANAAMGASAVSSLTPGMPADLQQRLQTTEDRIAELASGGVPAAAEIRRYELLHANAVKGGDFINLELTVLPDHGSPFDAVIDVLVASASTPKFQAGKTIYVKYDANQPQKIVMTGSDKPDTSRRMTYDEAV